MKRIINLFKTLQIISVLGIICMHVTCTEQKENKNVPSDNDSIFLIDTFGLQSPYPPYERRDSISRKKILKKDLAKEYVQRSKTEQDAVKKFWYLNQAIELDSTNAEAYYTRGIYKNMLESNLRPTSGCADICKAQNLGFPIMKGKLMDSCDCD